MRRAAAITAAETGDRPQIRHFSERVCPAMLETVGLAAVPYGQRSRNFAKIIDVPAFGFARAAMPGYAGAHAAWTESTPDVDVVAAREIKSAQASNLHTRAASDSEHKRVSARHLFHRIDYPPGFAAAPRDNKFRSGRFPSAIFRYRALRVEQQSFSSTSSWSIKHKTRRGVWRC